MLERFQAHLARTQLIPEGVRVLVGYSGGPDSTCLLHLMHRSGIPLVAAHLHHGQRPEAEDELERCKGLAEGLSVSFAAGRADVPLLSKESGMGMEEAGRQARYHFFSRAAAQFDCGLIATAHTRTDLVETMLLNATRGCGLTGLAGIPERRNNIVRPLLPFSRDETVAYCVEHGLWTHDDPANTDLSLARARVRHRVLGDLRSINPRVEEALFRL
ncbi:MAG: tRNA lysidine(34) synthetase TilS, partial [Fimbriimonas ginsengisoli]|nr:tRNA lysidine(34) synthetase TilS [Fimbriimonas ginsengisoli]